MFEFSILSPYQEPTRSKKGSQTTKVLAKITMVKVKYGDMRFSIKNIVAKNKLVILLILVGIFLRLYKLNEFATFLGDQGRDAIIIKRIITFEHFPAIGPTSSVGQVFLGPFFYYLMAPFLFLFRLNPLGLAFGLSFLSIVGLIAAYLIVRKEINKKVALFFLVLSVFSATQIEFARFSWNPNLLPIFSFLTLYFLYRSIVTKKYIWPILFGAFLSFSIQLHYLALFLFIPIFIFFIANGFKDKKFSISQFPNFLISGASFILFSSPLIIFDLKHNFLNTKNFIKIFTEQKVIAYSPPLDRLLTTINSFFSPILRVNFNPILTLLTFLVLIIYFFKNKSFNKNLFLQLNFLNFFLYIFVFSLLNSFRYPHYYGQIYLSFFLILAFISSQWSKHRWTKFIVIGLFIGYIALNSRNYIFLYKQGNRQIWRAKIVAQSIIKQKPQIPYQVVPIPYTEMDGHIRYFLEIMGKTPLSDESSEQPKELYILCYEKECDALNHPQWQIAAFKNKKVEKIWKVDRVKIYKLIHKNK
ncbi:hypothetical protein COY89_04715 [Candidatus Roizmanbacteria bacterium CG_4_10_14_0_8_um_filter_36_36]|uniref:Glycosyltransferase RgtA/B/C/D-like domain-containing protein n=1 Tax=Candidatus Roizmanbacteria bacterium CG10_big_fil_rev_8_21_14_0_10_36_26 TaxID=1974851 RepID=A0A2M8KK54_9BACT|nr:MAG: hypothetical protein COS51_02325 [Candidatus Roizmanbacteria bacterium CG03_land_8_20_14_0_80_36_21]PIY69788.1 MAG: hypothetical protein COY89_04715 [Candidatus Roizmanbacteria bacterium CG_4_10_14_0_8_um_filter_36_36]PJA53143.1 MAG: hypothetical protein CO166_02725 [Candidatus Roizmanbacteria bacterium CG_4_9_14_3_um_filter_36_11]PJE60295.1 MAG: hypothetical protein COU86_05300 [Candidatus Roizmanbacteria bacterium CG10_big_fil_rev_8_21_14_0_10_36_26]